MSSNAQKAVERDTGALPAPPPPPSSLRSRGLVLQNPNQRPRRMRSGGGFRVRLSYAIVFVSDMKRSVSFYRDALGLPLKFESPEWTEFATEGATLALHAGQASAPEENDPRKDPAGRCRPGLTVSNLDEFHRRMVEGNVPCAQEPRETFGARIAQYLDPDGLPISVSEERGR